MVPYAMVNKKLAPPVKSFTSPGGRVFTVGKGERDERWKGDPLWNDTWPILRDGKCVGKLFRNLNYGTTDAGKPRWQASLSELRWTTSMDAPTGLGFDVSALDTAKEAVVAWGRNADELLDWVAGKKVHSLYAKGGFFQKSPVKRSRG